MNIQMLQFKLNSILKQNATKRRKLATKGRIEPSRLAHYKTSNLLFSQPIPNTGKEYKCEFLLDVSGSMFGRRLGDAVIALQNLIKLFYGVIDFKITAFGNGSFPLSARQVLSLNPKEIYKYDYQVEHLRKRMSVKMFNGETHLIKTEDGESASDWATNGDLAVKASGEYLAEESGERFIVLLTDGGNNRDDKAHYQCGTKYIDRTDYRKTIREIGDNGIDILPISIGADYLSNDYDNYIQLDSPENVYEETLKFISDKFGEPINY